MKGRL